MASQFKDLFSGHSQDYAKFRPTYPKELFEYLASLTKAHDLAWDCGTGNGQAAIELAKDFRQVIATDPSEKQLSSAVQNPKVAYAISGTKAALIKDQSVDLVTVAQAFHWFNQPEFFTEVKRVAKPGGVLAIWCYPLTEITPEIDKVILKLYEGILGPYWEKERKLVDECYKNVAVPFEEITPPKISMKIDWSFDHFIGYLNTWSALQKYLKENQQNPIELVFKDLKSSWGSDQVRSVRWTLGLRVFRV